MEIWPLMMRYQGLLNRTTDTNSLGATLPMSPINTKRRDIATTVVLIKTAQTKANLSQIQSPDSDPMLTNTVHVTEQYRDSKAQKHD